MWPEYAGLKIERSVLTVQEEWLGIQYTRRYCDAFLALRTFQCSSYACRSLGTTRVLSCLT
jgi:hypothetical protein